MKILIVDDYPLILEGLEKFLRDSGYQEIFTATTGTEALAFINEQSPEIAILDMEIPHLSGLQIAQLCHQNRSLTRIIFLTYRLDPYIFQKGLEANIYGYILKDEAMQELLKCILRVSRGETYFSSKLMEIPEDASNDYQKYLLLSPSEQKILKLVASGKSSHEIADQLFISYRTVEKHRSNIIQKLGLDSRKEKLSDWVRSNIQFLS